MLLLEDLCALCGFVVALDKYVSYSQGVRVVLDAFSWGYSLCTCGRSSVGSFFSVCGFDVGL